MGREKQHKKLQLWKESMDLVTQLYRITKDFPREEEFGLKSQLRRAAVSVPSNIAEGLARTTKKEKLRFLSYARSSLSEIDAQIEIADRLELVSREDSDILDRQMTLVERLLSGLIRSIRS
ncbi:MAG: four helix bundle protein [Ignavibacteria bacterium]|nr:four helix bundle protein [Ignavibacteria bacterium]